MTTGRKYFKVGERNVGWLELDTGIFRKVVAASKHLFRTTDSWGIDYDVLKALPDDGEIRIKDSESGVIYITSVKRMRFGSVMRFKNKHEDYGAQVFYPRAFFDIIKDDVRADSVLAKTQEGMVEWFDDLDKEPKPKSVSHAKMRKK